MTLLSPNDLSAIQTALAYRPGDRHGPHPQAATYPGNHLPGGTGLVACCDAGTGGAVGGQCLFHAVRYISRGDQEEFVTNTGPDFSERLQKLREKKRISRRVLSELCGLTKSTISRYERGERRPSIDDASVLADFFGVTLDYLCGREK